MIIKKYIMKSEYSKIICMLVIAQCLPDFILYNIVIVYGQNINNNVFDSNTN